MEIQTVLMDAGLERRQEISEIGERFQGLEALVGGIWAGTLELDGSQALFFTESFVPALQGRYLRADQCLMGIEQGPASEVSGWIGDDPAENKLGMWNFSSTGSLSAGHLVEKPADNVWIFEGRTVSTSTTQQWRNTLTLEGNSLTVRTEIWQNGKWEEGLTLSLIRR